MTIITPTGETLVVTNEAVLEQYLKYGAKEVKVPTKNRKSEADTPH